ncbi:MAG: heparinase II/III family protein [Oscillospiraceae bacterium]|nr:heparinase II/III family protein [Oscillospiraceae bacterium]
MLKKAVSFLLAVMISAAALCIPRPLLSCAASDEPLKTRATFYTDEMVINARENAKKYSWAKSAVDSTVNSADYYLSKYSLEDLWALIPSQKVFRSYGVNQTYGCLNCGNLIDKFGNYPYKYDVVNDPWKITCPNCGMKFPTNDFGAYYKSGLDANGIFDPSKADRSLLKNTLYPEKGETWGVDDGTGYVAPDGKKYFFIAYYTHWALWESLIPNLIQTFSLAYLYTGKQVYADAGIVMLSRIGDLYPSFTLSDQKWADGYRHSGGDHGKIIGSIWETGLVDYFLKAYDGLFHGFPAMGDKALSLLESKSTKIQTYKDIMVNIENGLFKEVFPEVKSGNIHGNNGMHQYTLALAAVILDDRTLSKVWLDYCFAPGGYGNLSVTFVNDVDRDGFGNEASPGYNGGWINNFISIADLLDGYVINGTQQSYSLYDNVKFRKMFDSMLNLQTTKYFTPAIGDAASTGIRYTAQSSDILLKAYLRYSDVSYAQKLYYMLGGDVKKLKLTIWDENPEAIGSEIENAVRLNGEYQLSEQNLTGYGFASLRNIYNAFEKTAEALYTTVYSNKFSVINARIQTGLSRTETQLVFVPKRVNQLISFGFYLNNTEAPYTLSADSENSSGVFDVYFDGQLIANNMNFTDSTLISDKIYTCTGYHVISFGASAKDSKLAITSLSFGKHTDEKKQTAKNTETASYMYYGRNTGHGHADTLNIGLYAYGIDLMPDLGYPEFCDGTPHQVYWVENTVSHNTVLVNDRRGTMQIVAQPYSFDSNDFVDLISVGAPRVYPVTSEYKRTTALIRYDDDISYLVDFFKVTGGTKQTYSFHPAQSSAVVTSGVELVPQTDEKGEYIGTLAGRDVKWGSGNSESGYQYLDKVRRDDSPDEKKVEFDWSIIDTRNYSMLKNIHLKLTSFGDFSSVILANGTPPRNKSGNPSGLDYVLLNREKDDGLDTMFTSIIQPYRNSAYIVSSSLCEIRLFGKIVTGEDIKAIKLTFKNGRTDYIVCSSDEAHTYQIDGLFYFRGFFAVYSVRGTESVVYTNMAKINADTSPLKITGTVRAFTKELSFDNSITVSLNSDIDPAKLSGKYICIGNDSIRNSSYKILSAKRVQDENGANYILDIGDITLIRQYNDLKDLSKGFYYDISAGRTAWIPLSGLKGNYEFLCSRECDPVEYVIPSNKLRASASPGEKAANIYIVNTQIKNLFESPEYSISIDPGYSEGRMFTLNGKTLYTSDEFKPGLSAYNVLFNIEYKGNTYRREIYLFTADNDSPYTVMPEGLTLYESYENSEQCILINPQQLPERINFFYVGLASFCSAAILFGTFFFLRKRRD